MGGTEAFPDLGKHCQQSDCNQLDFLPFNCDGCRKVFCLEHRSYKSHECPRADHNSRKVVVCTVCLASIEKKHGDDDETLILERHRVSGNCDASKRRKAKCPVRYCRQSLTFSNSNTCRVCKQKTCLKHRFPLDHGCGDSLVRALAARSEKHCGALIEISSSSSSVKSC